MDVENGAAHRFTRPRLTADENCLDGALPVRVGAEAEDVLGVARSQDVRLPVDIDHRPECYWVTNAPGERAEVVAG